MHSVQRSSLPLPFPPTARHPSPLRCLPPLRSYGPHCGSVSRLSARRAGSSPTAPLCPSSWARRVPRSRRAHSCSGAAYSCLPSALRLCRGARRGCVLRSRQRTVMTTCSTLLPPSESWDCCLSQPHTAARRLWRGCSPRGHARFTPSAHRGLFSLELFLVINNRVRMNIPLPRPAGLRDGTPGEAGGGIHTNWRVCMGTCAWTCTCACTCACNKQNGEVS